MRRDEAFEREMTERLRQSADTLRRLEAGVAHSGAGGPGAEALEKLRAYQAQAEQRLQRLKEADEDTRAHFQAGLETAWSELRRRLADAVTGRPEPTGGGRRE